MTRSNEKFNMIESIETGNALQNLSSRDEQMPLSQHSASVPLFLDFSHLKCEDASEFVHLCRQEVAKEFVHGCGLEVGAGNRSFPLPEGVSCYYGDVRDSEGLNAYFGDTRPSSFDGRIDAQSFEGIKSQSQDFIISAHVIEHLENPVGAIEKALQALKVGGILILAVPDRRHTFDKDRPATSLIHLLQDQADGGMSTKLLAHEEHARFVHKTITGEVLSEDQILESAFRTMKAGMDLHFHCWNTAEFLELVEYCCDQYGAEVVAIGQEVVNENIFVIRATCGKTSAFV